MDADFSNTVYNTRIDYRNMNIYNYNIDRVLLLVRVLYSIYYSTVLLYSILYCILYIIFIYIYSKSVIYIYCKVT